MKDFKKLSRAEMKGVDGGVPPPPETCGNDLVLRIAALTANRRFVGVFAPAMLI